MRKLDSNAHKIFLDRYAKEGETEWEHLTERVASHICGNNLWLKGEVKKILDNRDFLFNSPTLMNAGTALSQLSACFVVPILEDSMKGIFKAIQDMAEIQKCGGGTGFDFSVLREKDALVNTTKGRASGVISFLRVFNSASRAVEQGGVRRGANMAKLDCDHPDLVDFIKYKAEKNKIIDSIIEKCPEHREFLEDRKELTYFNLSVGATDIFMRAVRDWAYLGQDSVWTFYSRKDGRPHSTMNISTLWDLITVNAHSSGDPGLLFMDVINRFNPTPVLVMKATNPCGEQPLYDYESCNLGSINIYNHMSLGEIDWKKLEHTVRVAVRALDKIVEINHYPLQENKINTQANAKIGLGVMGIADMLYEMGIRYGSGKSYRVCEEVMSFVNDTAFDESYNLAVQAGSFPNWSISVYADKGIPMRNASRTTIAPTGSIAILAGVSSGIEPNFLLAYDRVVRETHKEGSYTIRMVNPVLVKVLKEHELYSEELLDKIVKNNGRLNGLDEIPDRIKEVFVTAFDISTEEHLLMQQAFQKHTDNAVSKTINMPATATPEEIGKAYIKAWELGLKGITIYRDGSLGSQVLKSANKEVEESLNEEELLALQETMREQGYEPEVCPECGKATLAPTSGCSVCLNCGYSPCHNS